MMEQKIIAINTASPDRKETAFTQKAWLNLRKIGDTQYLYLRIETVVTNAAPPAKVQPKAATKGCGCGKK